MDWYAPSGQKSSAAQHISAASLLHGDGQKTLEVFTTVNGGGSAKRALTDSGCMNAPTKDGAACCNLRIPIKLTHRMSAPDSISISDTTAHAVVVQCPCSALRDLVADFIRMGDDANHVRLRHLNPRPGHIEADTMTSETSAAQAQAYYNCARAIERLLPNNSDD